MTRQNLWARFPILGQRPLWHGPGRVEPTARPRHGPGRVEHGPDGPTAPSSAARKTAEIGRFPAGDPTPDPQKLPRAPPGSGRSCRTHRGKIPRGGCKRRGVQTKRVARVCAASEGWRCAFAHRRRDKVSATELGPTECQARCRTLGRGGGGSPEPPEISLLTFGNSFAHR